MQSSYKLHPPGDAVTVPLVRALSQDAMCRLGVISDDVDDVGLAITEACTNVALHAAGGVQYEVHVELGANDCHIRVVDSGVGFTASEPDRSMPRPSESRGRGIALLEQLMDQIQFDSPPGSGTVVHLHKRLTMTEGSLFWNFGPEYDAH